MRNCLRHPHPGASAPRQRRCGQGHRLTNGATRARRSRRLRQGRRPGGNRRRPWVRRRHSPTGGPRVRRAGTCGWRGRAAGPTGLGWRKRCFGAADTTPQGPRGPPRICRQDVDPSQTSVRGGPGPTRQGRKTGGVARRAARTELRQSPDRASSSHVVRGCARAALTPERVHPREVDRPGALVRQPGRQACARQQPPALRRRWKAATTHGCHPEGPTAKPNHSMQTSVCTGRRPSGRGVSDWHGQPRWQAHPLLRQRQAELAQVDRVALEFGERPERARRASARTDSVRAVAEAARLAQQAPPGAARRASARSEATGGADCVARGFWPSGQCMSSGLAPRRMHRAGGRGRHLSPRAVLAAPRCFGTGARAGTAAR
jgi:hypothetical protein